MNFWEKNKLFFAIILGAVIIGIFVYFSLENQKKIASSLEAPRNDVVGKSVEDGPPLTGTPIASACGVHENTFVTKVIDGDTVVVEGGYHVRLLGMDADEKNYPCYEPAKTRLENLVLGKMVKLEKDRTDLDQYGRCLRYIFIGNTNIGAQLVKEGMAIARFYNPDIKYKTEIAEAEKRAQQNKAGCKWK
ncbi:MAG: hypothetical protein A2528_01860 [Candidatus Staskawiczbacteria bacterium RIFOXYD2_FULL_37_9]|uniref:TNase-like domain-containing protein n=1 Tax=Candidatus Staskawiczbacteria bacterium RIFOXYB1_FULL_37_44 TaxID=1802223 RepID=A0A1G2IY25_9BACT|nr:MAG: hypothetical protein A2358_01305 [Candidatus Staskawiczbacteria bacterium RIFOXYB1_FULL_37_44]OGZ83343.1 MAG: hypothetical protein A2416_02040 [Candidatus Staskawiczbacteria bacterium RIFOXYC1_FULL_37_52]OGZ88746.1 MAG: hypothetical protein A2581_02980 [Candidatus Staskawiczbacteria bacterium RIFOXYD1_FULL_37_110]OGZ89492.1 MAG: hypothetical protein A2444_03025 [Candidatus Staskawiczbacteria bacterium RIFOXYC2_FULL_37_19]OGZ93569.1 MAG: hypothetical protein A2528_01860 [Candidatus Stask